MLSTANLDPALFNASPNGVYFACNKNDANVNDQVRSNPKFFDIKAYRTLNMANIIQETPNIVDPEADV
jgi:hypothetical protein